MSKCEPMRNGVAYTSGFDKILQERFQRVCRGIGRRMVPIYSSVDHFTFQPTPFDEVLPISAWRSSSVGPTSLTQ